MPKRKHQIELPIDMGRERCMLCRRPIEGRCKWCQKGGFGDPPVPVMKAHKRWTRGIEKTIRRRLALAGLPEALVDRALAYILRLEGELPAEAAPLVQDVLPETRPSIAARSYARCIPFAILRARLFELLHEERAAHILRRDEPLEAKMARWRPMTPKAIVEEMRSQNERHMLVCRDLDTIAGIAIEAIVRLRAAGITAEQRSALEVLRAAEAVFDGYGPGACGRFWSTWAIAAHGYALALEEQRKIAAAVPVSEDLLELIRAQSRSGVPIDDEIWLNLTAGKDLDLIDVQRTNDKAKA